MDHTLYEILGVSHEATPKELKTAYHALLLKTHPDKGNEKGAFTVSELKRAYATLSDGSARTEYDAELAARFKKQGFNITGAGLDGYTLAEFTESHDSESDTFSWKRACPRCRTKDAIAVDENDLERGTPDGAGFLLAVPCQTCSLWITVLYDVE